MLPWHAYCSGVLCTHPLKNWSKNMWDSWSCLVVKLYKARSNFNQFLPQTIWPREDKRPSVQTKFTKLEKSNRDVKQMKVMVFAKREIRSFRLVVVRLSRALLVPMASPSSFYPLERLSLFFSTIWLRLGACSTRRRWCFHRTILKTIDRRGVGGVGRGCSAFEALAHRKKQEEKEFDPFMSFRK